MNRSLVRLLLWFFIAVLPVQGFAGVMRMCCGSAPAAVMAAMPAQATMADHAAMPGMPGMPRMHDDAPPAPAHCAAMASAAAHTTPADSEHGCAACAACCLAAALMSPGGLPVFVSERLSTAVASAPHVLFSGHIPAGLERPPRPSLA